VAGTCECDNENSGSIKCGEFLDWLRNCQLLRKGSAAWSILILCQNLILFIHGKAMSGAPNISGNNRFP
jgi:hypothetical protein